MSQPETKFVAGAVVATVWKNQKFFNGHQTEYNTISLERRYVKDGQCQSTNNLRTNDLPKAALVLQKAYEYLLLKNKEIEEEIIA